jgi:Tol biopolymer transport system component
VRPFAGQLSLPAVLLEGGASSHPASSALSARSSLAAGAGRSRIAFISEPPRGGYCGTVYVMNSDGSGQRRLTNGGVPGCGQEGGAAWSPDGRRIALSAWFPNAVGAGMKVKIVVMKPDGTGQRRLTRSAGDEYSPAWSPDGRQITFIGPDAGILALYVVNADGTGQRRLAGTGTGYLFASVWSPDAQRIAFVANAALYIVNADWTRASISSRSSGLPSRAVRAGEGGRGGAEMLIQSTGSRLS